MKLKVIRREQITEEGWVNKKDNDNSLSFNNVKNKGLTVMCQI